MRQVTGWHKIDNARRELFDGQTDDIQCDPGGFDCPWTVAGENMCQEGADATYRFSRGGARHHSPSLQLVYIQAVIGR